MTYTTYIPSPVGMLCLASDGTAITGLWLTNQKYYAFTLKGDTSEAPALPVFRQAEAWLDAYFGRSQLPDMPPLAPVGTSFRQEVWRVLQEIPYGQTTTYGEIARKLRAIFFGFLTSCPTRL